MALVFLVCTNASVRADDPAVSILHPYSGASSPGASVPGVDRTTLTGKIMCGYQGWFTATGDGSNLNWWHYSKGGKFEPGNCGFDFWPDVTELDRDELYATPFAHADGSAAYLCSAQNPKTVIRHFKWMEQYGIDGAFVQRFAVDTFGPATLNHLNTLLNSCRDGANQHGRAYAVMYDLSGLKANQIDRVMDDWKTLVGRMHLTRDPQDKAYLHHNGKPVVAVWGIGFNDHRKYSLDDCRKLIDFLKDDPICGGCTVMVGVPAGWRTLNADAVPDKTLLDVIGRADIVSPWTVGRYNSPMQAAQFAQSHVKPDIAWCDAHHLGYLPVAFPGFSWHNLNLKSPSDQIPRLKGQFLWAQYVQDKRAGATMMYQAMFDEVNEGTAIFKCTNDVPVGDSKFVTYEGLPGDYYLNLAGSGGKLIRGEIEATDALPPQK